MFILILCAEFAVAYMTPSLFLTTQSGAMLPSFCVRNISIIATSKRPFTLSLTHLAFSSVYSAIMLSIPSHSASLLAHSRLSSMSSLISTLIFSQSSLRPSILFKPSISLIIAFFAPVRASVSLDGISGSVPFKASILLMMSAYSIVFSNGT